MTFRTWDARPLVPLKSWRVLAAPVFIVALAVPTAGATEVTPEKVKAALPELENQAEQTLKKTGVPGMAIAVVYKDQVVYLKGFGVREAGREGPVDADTVFQLASLSKPLAATVLAALLGDGVIGWDDRVIDHDPGFRLYDPWVTREVTLRDLLCHRSGLPEHAGDLLEDLGYGRAEILRRLRYERPASSFRAQFAYTNFGYTAAAVAAARAAGASWEDLAADKLYRPLGMASSSWRFADYATAKNRALLHVRADGGSPGTSAIPTLSPRPAGPAPRCGTWLSGCACCSAAAGSKASKSLPPRPWMRRTALRSSVVLRRPRQTAQASTGWAGM